MLFINMDISSPNKVILIFINFIYIFNIYKINIKYKILITDFVNLILFSLKLNGFISIIYDKCLQYML